MVKKRWAALQGELDLRLRTWGGAREGSGRKKKPGKKEPAHRTRPELRRYHPVHVVMRVRKDVPRLRNGRAYRAIRRVLVRCLGNDAFRVCHLSIQSNHLHFIIEARDRDALAAGMQRLNILTARALNRELGRKGTLFAFRYHATQIDTPKHARNTLSYVLNNWRKHREDEISRRAHEATLDPYASSLSFDGWTLERRAASALRRAGGLHTIACRGTAHMALARGLAAVRPDSRLRSAELVVLTSIGCSRREPGPQ